MAQPLNNHETRRIYEFIRDYWQAHGHAPSLREIGEGCYMAHTSILPHLAQLEAREWIVREIGLARSIRLGRLAPDYRKD